MAFGVCYPLLLFWALLTEYKADQWEEEIDNHAPGTLRNVVKYKGPQFPNINRLNNADVVLAAYKRLTLECPWFSKDIIDSLRKKNRCEGDRPQDDDPAPIEKAIAQRIAEGQCGLLFKVFWGRVCPLALCSLCYT